MPGTNDPRPPFLLIDDGGWINIYNSTDDLIDDQEPPFVDEVTFLIDSQGNLMRLVADDDSVHLETLDSEIDLNRLQESVDRFFRAWTDNAPPRHDLPTKDYLSEIFALYRSATFRGRMRKER
ncbi:hypothetical protein ACQHIV_12380 [Kribbella sp. GL6]|uniref:hypothetical protein n=1 Tax=Kribbella sp. GL6 TaxID=3419765 RepID=UPI003CFDC150